MIANQYIFMKFHFMKLLGPFSEAVLVYTPPPSPAVNYIYGTTGTNLYDTNGKTSSVDFTWCYDGGYANWVAQLNFL